MASYLCSLARHTDNFFFFFLLGSIARIVVVVHHHMTLLHYNIYTTPLRGKSTFDGPLGAHSARIYYTRHDVHI